MNQICVCIVFQILKIIVIGNNLKWVDFLKECLKVAKCIYFYFYFFKISAQAAHQEAMQRQLAMERERYGAAGHLPH